jgi:hypothetical protein
MATTPKLTRKTVIGVKTETTQGTPASLAATDFFLAEDVNIKPSVEMLDRNFYRTSLDSIASVAGKRLYELSFKTELKGSGTAGTIYAPIDALIQACGFTSTPSAGVSVTYAPSSAAASSSFFGPGKSCTFEVYRGGIKHIMAGAIGSMKISVEVNKYAMLEFSFKGVFATPSDNDPGTTTFLAQKPAVVVAASLSLAGLAAIATKFDIDCANEVVERPDLSATTGLKGFMISGRKPSGSCDPEMETVAAHPFIANLLAGTEAQSSLVIGATAGNIVTITLPKTQYTGAGYGDRNGILTGDIPLQFNQSTGDDWMSMVMT